MRKLSVEWFEGARSDKDKQIREELIRNSAVAIDTLQEIMERWLKELEQKDLKEADFDNPNWAYKQAYRNGERSRIRKVMDLLSFRNGD